MSYRELQAACKERGLGAKGKTDELRAKLVAAVDAGPAAASSPPKKKQAKKAAAKKPPAAAATDDLLDDLIGMMEADDFGDVEGVASSASPSTGLPPDFLDELLNTSADEEADGATPIPPSSAKPDDFDDALFDELLRELDSRRPSRATRSIRTRAWSG